MNIFLFSISLIIVKYICENDWDKFLKNSMIFTIINSSCLLAFVLLIFFRTEAFVEYCQVFHLNFLSNYKDYYEKKKDDVTLTYHGYLRQYHNNFFTRLITCPICVTVWLCIGLTLWTGHLIIFPIAFFGGLILFGIVHKLLN
jgi:hypothetical protein